MISTEVLAALLGVLITGLLGLYGYYLKSRLDLDREVRSRHFEQRFSVYKQALDSAFDPYQVEKQPSIDQVAQINKDLLLGGSPEVVRAFNQVSDTSAHILKQKGMTDEAIRLQQTRALKTLVNAIRVDLYPHQKPLSDDDIRFVRSRKGQS